MTQWLLALSIVAIAWHAEAAPSCPGFGGDKAFDALIKKLSAETSCKVALDTLHACRWGSSADTSFSPIVVSTCERDFYGTLPPAARLNYGRRMQMCAYRYARQDGTLYMSAAALCQADLAGAFAADPAKADVPIRASFDCARARTALETAICTHDELGRDDIILSEAYEDAVGATARSADPNAKAKLAAEERRFIDAVAKTCRLDGSTPATDASVACAASAFETRFMQFDQCSNGDDCLGIVTEIKPPSDKPPAPRASFDCRTPRTALETVICADAALGRADLALARAYHDAVDKMGDSQHAELVSSERGWLRFASSACPLGAVGGMPPALARACVRAAYQTRMAQLEACPKLPEAERVPCLDDFHVMAKR